MSNLERIKLLKDYCDEEPQNPFNFYALALEYRESEKVEATNLFDFVVFNFPNYLLERCHKFVYLSLRFRACLKRK